MKTEYYIIGAALAAMYFIGKIKPAAAAKKTYIGVKPANFSDPYSTYPTETDSYSEKDWINAVDYKSTFYGA